MANLLVFPKCQTAHLGHTEKVPIFERNTLPYLNYLGPDYLLNESLLISPESGAKWDLTNN